MPESWTDGLDPEVVEFIRDRNEAIEELLDHIQDAVPVVEPMFRALFIADTRTVIELRRLETKVQGLEQEILTMKGRT